LGRITAEVSVPRAEAGAVADRAEAVPVEAGAAGAAEAAVEAAGAEADSSTTGRAVAGARRSTGSLPHSATAGELSRPIPAR